VSRPTPLAGLWVEVDITSTTTLDTEIGASEESSMSIGDEEFRAILRFGSIAAVEHLLVGLTEARVSMLASKGGRETVPASRRCEPTPAAVASAMSDPSPLPTPRIGYPRPGFGAAQQLSAGGAP